MRPTSAKSAKRPKSAMSPKCPKSAMSPQSAMSAISPKNRLNAISPKTTPSGPQNGTAADAAIKQFGIWIPENSKNGPKTGAAWRTPLLTYFVMTDPFWGPPGGPQNGTAADAAIKKLWHLDSLT